MERRPISVNLRKINDIKTLKVYILYKNIIIPRAHKDVPYRSLSSFDQVMGF